ncbi:MAG: chromosome segregation protein SMC, partial [Chloroflexi bacterium]|nr:chromosome segregation protein SMC [Chloroflexota bacterium]
QELLAGQGRLTEAEKALREAQAERDRLALRRETLLRLRQEGTAYSPGVRKVLAPESGLKGILGTVSSLMSVPREYERAIEAALGSRLQQVIVEHWEDAEAAIALLKRTRAGWATFLPLDTLRPPSPLAAVAWPGVVGVASHLVRFEERLRPALDLLLGRVLVVTDLAVARRLLGERTGASLIVTLDGETVQPSGAVSGGARAEKGHLLAQEREWRE